ncbi:YbjN domain-containing protein [Anaerolineales bacterium HSG25]|nr:YbjN domain-containing protein [Anaerolineales bacterium HSG25]
MMDENISNGYGRDMGIDPDTENLNGLRAFARLGDFLNEDSWYPQQLKGKHVYSTNYSGQNGTVRCYAQIRVDLEQFMFYVLVPINAPTDNLPQVAEYITRANFGMRVGNFELDYSDGEIRYKSSLDFEGEILSNNLIKNVIYPAVQTTDRYLSGLLSVIYGGKTALEAITEVEGSE